MVGAMTGQTEFARVRAKLGLTRAQMADALGLSQSYYWRLEAGEKPSNKRHALALQAIEANPPQVKNGNKAKDETTNASTELDAG